MVWLIMEKEKEKSNLFSSGKTTSSINIFGGITQCAGETPLNIQSTESSSKIICKPSENPPPTLHSEKSIFSIQSDPSKKDEKNNPVNLGAENIFENELSSTSSSSSSSEDDNIFGGKVSISGSQDKPFDSHCEVTLSTSTSSEVGSIFRQAESKPIEFTLKPASHSTTLIRQLTAPAPVFSSQQNKDTKSISLFGGKVVPSNTFSNPKSDTFSFIKQTNSSSEGIKNENLIFGQSTLFRKTTLDNLPKPALVFDSKFKKKAENKQSNIVFTNTNKIKSESNPEFFATSQLTKIPKTTAGSSNLFLFAKQQDNNDEEDWDVFQSDSKDSTPEVKTAAHESTNLIAVDIPPNIDKGILENHFSKFGPLKKVVFYKQKNQASILFKTHEAAVEAKAKGKKLHPNIPEIKLFFGIETSAQHKKESKFSKEASGTVKKRVFVKSREMTPKVPLTVATVEKSKPSPIQKKSEFKGKAPSGNLGSIKDLSVLMKSQAKNNYDKYLILDARDKVLRSNQKKESDVNKAQYLLATCPDMCPEKERYSRDIQYDLSIYEITDGEINHKLAVKKFSRSSADKDEPLPHELRPGPVLKKTIDFLICNLMNKGDDPNVQIELWYNYLFNRTRALRNDIMQQHLIDANAIYVLERCTRFHIHCSHHLCEESTDYFDPKINAEHLTKSLQSLKELYHDMSERGQYFKTEPEFRAYEILLSVYDGNVIFKIMKFRDSVRNSSEVQLAIQVLLSLQTKNYVKFFRLLREATYLQSCIMHKYFGDFRLKMLNVIAKTYKSKQLPASKFGEMLGFSESEFQNFKDYYEITLNEESKVLFDKARFLNKQNLPPPLTKSSDILMKKHASTAQIVQNGPTPENPLFNYEPHQSFDSLGYLKRKALNASDQNFVIESVKPLKDIEDKSSDEDDNESLKKTLYARVEEMDKLRLLRKYYNAWVNYVQLQREKQQMKEKLELIISKKFTKIWKQKIAETAEFNKKVDKYLQRKYLKKWKSFTHYSHQQKEYIQKAKLIEERIILRKFLKIWQAKAAYKKSLRCAQNARQYLLSHKFASKWRSYTEMAILERKSKKFYDDKILKMFFNQWRSWFIFKRKQSKIDFESFPAIANQLPPIELNKLLDWSYDRKDSLNMSAYEIAQLDRDITIKSRQHFSLQQLSGIVAWTALPLLQRFQADVNSRIPNFSGNVFNKYFKLLILTCPKTDTYLLEWVRTKFNILEAEDLTIPLQSTSQFISHCNQVTYTVIVTEKEISFDSKIDIDGASVVILVGNENNLPQMKNLAFALSNVSYLVMCKSKCVEKISENLWLMTKESVDSPFTSEKLFHYIFYLWKSRSDRRDIQISKCSNLADKFISEKVLSPLYCIVNQKKLYNKPTVCLLKIIDFYNAAISHLQACIKKAKDIALNWLPPELSLLPLKLDKYLNDTDTLMKDIEKALLPPFHLQMQSSISIRDQLTKYLQSVALDDWDGSLFSEVERILKKTEKRFIVDDEISASVEKSCSELFQQVPWVNILSCCIFFKLSLLPTIEVAYSQSDIDMFDQNKQWISSLSASELRSLSPNKDAELQTKRKVPLVEIYPEIKKRKTAQSQFLKDIEEEKQKYLKLEEELQSQMLVEEELKRFFPNYEETMLKFDH